MAKCTITTGLNRLLLTFGHFWLLLRSEFAVIVLWFSSPPKSGRYCPSEVSFGLNCLFIDSLPVILHNGGVVCHYAHLFVYAQSHTCVCLCFQSERDTALEQNGTPYSDSVGGVAPASAMLELKKKLAKLSRENEELKAGGALAGDRSASTETHSDIEEVLGRLSQKVGRQRHGQVDA